MNLRLGLTIHSHCGASVPGVLLSPPLVEELLLYLVLSLIEGVLPIELIITCQTRINTHIDCSDRMRCCTDFGPHNYCYMKSFATSTMASTSTKTSSGFTKASTTKAYIPSWGSHPARRPCPFQPCRVQPTGRTRAPSKEKLNFLSRFFSLQKPTGSQI